MIHIGGDETPTEKWEQCPKCQALDLQGNTLQGYFTQRVFEFLKAHGRRALGWDELLENHAPQDAMIMSWRGTAPGAKAAEAGHDVVMSPTTHCYFDYHALAEVQWTESTRKDYDAFRQRLTRFTALFDRYGYIYAKHLWPERQIPSRWQF